MFNSKEFSCFAWWHDILNGQVDHNTQFELIHLTYIVSS
jgi:hypothetical protein